MSGSFYTVSGENPYTESYDAIALEWALLMSNLQEVLADIERPNDPP